MLMSAAVFLYMTGCKTCFGIAIFLPLACIILYIGYHRVRYFPLLALGVATTFVGFAACLIAIAGASMDDVLQLLVGDPTLTGRTEIWALVIERIAERPLLGYGWMAFWGAYEANPIAADVPLTSWISGVFLNSGHNGYLDMALEAGLIGLVLSILVMCRFIWVYGKLLWLPWPDYRQPRLLATFFCTGLCLLLNNTTESLVFISGLCFTDFFIFIYLVGELQYLLNDPSSVRADETSPH
jgi:O-antigen ligase